MSIDTTTLDGVVELREPTLTTLVTAVTHTGGTVAVAVVTTVLTMLMLRAGRRDDALLLSATILTGWPLMSLLKLQFGRERPPQPVRLVELTTHSFPSGHAMMTAMLATVLAVVIAWQSPPGSRRALVAYCALGAYTLAVGLSRVYLAAHWLTDVVAGWLLGSLWALLWVGLITRVRARL
ncbi:phosphatase PAP2 family protein [Rhodococcus sp. 14C212]|uniref:phosphatase PAP2 family protein n=1 Tax=Rhodococcus sp. 14C212 TaxID=2711209 RepID=UPI00197EC73E|nr:phosphatase PAP2 family protein [Rhodococcus sp. 14C212]